MARTIQLKERDLTKLINTIINEQQELNEIQNCTTDGECADMDTCGRYKCDTGSGNCYLPWNSEPCNPKTKTIDVIRTGGGKGIGPG